LIFDIDSPLDHPRHNQNQQRRDPNHQNLKYGKGKYSHHEGGAGAGGSGFFSAFETCFGLALLPNIHIAKLPGIAGPLAFAFLLPEINCQHSD
jgi:hypothetical protein